jgi:hypothetical protein
MRPQFLESFTNKHISSSEDRLEETKRKKLASKSEKLVELMMVSGIPTASGYEERIRFSEMEVVERGANEQGLLINMPEGKEINGWDVNVAGVRTTSVKRTVRYHTHAVSRPLQSVGCGPSGSRTVGDEADISVSALGVHPLGQAGGPARPLRRSTIRGVCPTTQASPDRAAWKGAATPSAEDQNFHDLDFAQRSER